VPFSYTSGNPANLVGGNPAAMIDIRGPFADILAYLNTGIPTPPAAPVFAATNTTVSDIGQSGQIRAGRQLAATDFTNMGLAVPLGLWNLGDLTDASGNGRALTNKGSVPFGVGINGTATTAAQFAGSTAQALYIADTGGADPFRIKTGSWGCWFRTAKRTQVQYLMAKAGGAVTPAVTAWTLSISSGNVLVSNISEGSTLPGTSGVTDVCDDRWHFAVITHDGTRLRIYVDGALDGSNVAAIVIAGAAQPLNIGAVGADGATAASAAHYGRVDEAFVTADVLTEDQIRLLYSARLAHTLAAVPGDTRILIRRRRRGGPLATTDFPTTPVRLHNFTAGVLTDQGTGGVTLAPVGGGTIVTVGGADGIKDGAYSFAGAHTGLGATDAGLPAGTTARSYGCWFKTTTAAGAIAIIGWGTLSTADARIYINTGVIQFASGADNVFAGNVADGLWHQVIGVEDNAAGDGVKRKLYLDGRVVQGSTVLNTLTLVGANRFRVGANPDGTGPFVGQIDGAFVHSVALTGEQVRALYSVGSQQLAASPKDAADHVEAVTSTDLLLVLDSVEATDSVDVTVGP
jgi:hypothetical protein